MPYHQKVPGTSLDYQRLRFEIFDPKQPPRPSETADYHQAYYLWKKVWLQTYAELEGVQNIYSDDFYRQQEAFCIFYDRECVGLTMHSYLDLKNPIHRDLRYFKAYPPGSIEAIEELGVRRVLISNQTAVDSQFRKSLSGIAFADVLVGLTVQRLLRSDCEAFIAYTNNSKKVQDIAYRFGAKPIVQGHSQHNVEVDIVCLEKKMARPSPIDEVNQLVEILWTSKNHEMGEPTHWAEAA